MQRRHDLDWVRTCAFALLVLYHVGMYYVTWEWHVDSPHASPALEPFMMLSSPWRLGLQHPRESRPLATLPLYDGEAIGTSGDYQRYFEINGYRYSHLLDPRTGGPAHESQSVTVLVTPREGAGTLSDAASKPAFIAGGNWREYTRRFGIDQYFPSSATSSCVQQATMCRSASSHIARVSVGSIPKPSSSARVEERPLPNSTRPFETRSSTAADSAERTGWLYGFGSRRTP